MRDPNQASGISMVELLIFIVVVSVAVVGVLSVLNVTARSSADPMIHKQMLAIAEGLMEEVSMQPFTYCDPDDPSATTATIAALSGTSGCSTAAFVENGPMAGEARTGATPFDNVVDYSGVAALNPVTDIAGNSNPNLAGYTATIQIVAENLSGIASTPPAATMNALRIAVTVNHGSENLILESYRTRHSPNSVP